MQRSAAEAAFLNEGNDSKKKKFVTASESKPVTTERVNNIIGDI